MYDIVRTMFASFNLGWRDVTFENMFDKAEELSKVEKSDFEYMKFVPLGQAGNFDPDSDRQHYQFANKMQERLARRKEKIVMGLGNMDPDLELELQKKKASVAVSPRNRIESLATPQVRSAKKQGSPFKCRAVGGPSINI